jgi:hypothetical protein
MKAALEECNHRAGAAADVEHLLAWPKACLIKKRLSRCIPADPAARVSAFQFGTTSATTPHSCVVRAVSGCGFSRNASALPAPGGKDSIARHNASGEIPNIVEGRTLGRHNHTGK